MNGKFLIYIFLSILVICEAEAQELPLTHFTTDSESHKLPSAMITDVYQDRQGFIWFPAFSTGVVRFDGTEMLVFDHSDGLEDLSVWQIVEDGKGYLWISSNAGLVVSKKPLSEFGYDEEISFTSIFEGIELSTEAISHNEQMTVDAEGRILLGAAKNGIIRYSINSEGQLKTDTISTGFSGRENLGVTTISRGASSEVIAGLEGGSVAIFNGKEGRIIYRGEISEGETISSLYMDEGGSIWAFTQAGNILKISTSGKKPVKIYNTYASNITSITPVSGTEIFATNGASGIIRIDKATAKVRGSYTRRNGLLNNNVYDILEDRENNIWIAQSGGLSRLRHNFRAFENYTANPNGDDKPMLPSGKITSIYVPESANTQEKFWVGTEGGGAIVGKNGNSEFLTTADGLLADWINGISADSEGRVWLATPQGLNGVVRDKNKIVTNAYDIRNISILGEPAFLFSVKDSPPVIASEAIRITDRAKTRQLTTVWFPGVRSLYGLVGGEAIHLGPEDGLPASVYESVAIDEDGFIWVGTRDMGLYKSNRPVHLDILESLTVSKESGLKFYQVYSAETGAPTNRIQKILFYNNKLWVGGQKGLVALDPETSRIKNQLNYKDGLPADNAVSFAVSPVTGMFWVGTNSGLAEVEPVVGKVLKVVDEQDGLVGNEVWLYGSVRVDKKGKVYFGTADGLSIYSPELDTPNEVAPLLHLKSADISYKSDSRNEVSFEYVALSYANVPEVTYQTRLNGYEKNWSSPTKERRLRYTNLPAYFWPKKYTLEVLARNGSGTLAKEPLLYSFQVDPVWWLKWWAFLIYLITLSALVFVTDRVQRARVIKRERERALLREAELQAESATARSNAAESQAKALQAENDKKAVELEKAKQLKLAYEELKAAQNQVVQAEKMASLGRLATGIAHEIKNPLNFINNFAELSVELLEELVEAINKGDEEEIEILMNDIKMNTSKIEEHGKRADAIVKSMMQHARGGKSTFELLDLNDLVNKYTGLAYHGKRAQVRGFSVRIEKDLEPDLHKVNVVGQEIGQVLLNIVGNSLDAVWAKKQKEDDYEPRIRISTRTTDAGAEIKISDNGPGVPQEIREKIFEPFFTTKPTGEGTGLGLSLSYNIITQGHNGVLQLDSSAKEGATFTIILPLHTTVSQKQLVNQRNH